MLRPFSRFCVTIGAIPPSIIKSLSYEQQLLRLIKWLKEVVIPTIDYNVETINELQQHMIELENYVNEYFNNLDVTEEINNKLDQMVEDGTLSELLGQYRYYVHIQELGAIGDGETDNATILQDIFDTYKNIYIDDGVYYSSETLYLSSDTTIIGKGTLKSNIYIIGDNGENIPFTEITANKITSEYEFEVNDLLKVFYENISDNTDNKRQMVVTTSTDGKLSNNLLNYADTYSVRKCNSKKNIKINDISIIGNIRLEYAQDIYFNNITLENGYIAIAYCYNYNLTNSQLKLGNDKRVDGMCGSSNLTFDNLKFLGGNTPSDNSALKLNEVFYSNVNNCNFGTPNRDVDGYDGYFHAIMIDGSFLEDNYPQNESQFINISNCNISKGYSSTVFIALSKNINVVNVTGEYFHNKNSDNVTITNSYFTNVYNELNNTNLKFSNSYLGIINSGSRKNMSFENCKIDTLTLAQGTDNIKLNNCIIDQISNSYVSANSAHNIMLNNCEVLTKCELKGIQYLIGNIITHASCLFQETHNSNIDILVIENVGSIAVNIGIHTCSNSKIYYNILESALATTPINQQYVTNCIIETPLMRKTNNNNANYTQNVTKGAGAPTSDTETHYRGEIIYNYAPTAGGYVGWICVTGGSPGTWKGFGAIES